MLTRRLNSVVLTEDSDFGDWVFAHQEPTLGVVFLRYRHNQRDLVSSVVLDLVRRHGSGLYGKFVTVTAKKIRVREIWATTAGTPILVAAPFRRRHACVDPDRTA